MYAGKELFEIELDTKIWTSGPQKFAAVPQWAKTGLIRPPDKKGLKGTLDDKSTRKLSRFKFDAKDQKLKPFKKS